MDRLKQNELQLTAVWQNGGFSTNFNGSSSIELLYKTEHLCFDFRHFAKLQNVERNFMTKIHQDIFEKIKPLLKEHFKEDLKEFEEGTHLTIADSGIWISADDTELTIGYGLAHRHYNPEHDDILGGIDQFFNLLTKRKKITTYFKGDFCYKNKTEIELAKDNYDDMGISMTWLFPFWKTTVEMVKFEDKLIDSTDFENSITTIKTYAQQAFGKKAGSVVN